MSDVRTALAPVTARLALALTPARSVVLRETADADELDAALAGRLRAAWARGAGHGLLHLGAAEAETPLPADIGFWRDLGRLFVARLCAQPDLEAERRRLQVPVPEGEVAALAAAAPPMAGSEYVDAAALAALWEVMNAACRAELAAFTGTVEEFLQSRHAAWHLVGRVHVHLAENRGDPDAPFAFMASYSTRLSSRSRPVHRPLGEAIREYAGEGNRAKLLALLEPLQRAAARCPWLRELVDSGDVYSPLAFTPDEAYQLLQDIPALEESGVVVRVPDWWRARRPPRPQVQVTVGTRPPGGVGTDALLDFDVRLTLDGETLSPAELSRLASTSGLALIRGKWVELDAARLREALDHWQKVKAAAGREGLGFIEGMRLLAGAALGGDEAAPTPETAAWSEVVAGGWLKEALDGLRQPDGLRDLPLPLELRAELRPYQEVGVRWLALLHRLGLGACLADDMGLGKTVQVLALLLGLKERALNGSGQAPRPPALLVVPASLIANWTAEVERFAPSLRVRVAHPSGGAYALGKAPEGARAMTKRASRPPEAKPEAPGVDGAAGPSAGSATVREATAEPWTPAPEDLAGVDLVITTYGLTHRLPWLAERRWPLVVLDEAQAIKNPGAKQSRAVKALRARSRVAMTGTPVENRLGDLWSLFDFLNPGLLGSARAFTSFAKRLEEKSSGYGPLRELTRPYILRRLKTDRRIIADLPDKTEVRAYCGLTRAQAALYQQSVKALAEALDGPERPEGIERRGLVLSYLMRFKQICNHPSQWLRDGVWDPAGSGKFARLRELAEVIAAKQEKALIFTQFREVTEPLAAFLAEVFGRPGLLLHGETPVRDRRALVERFQRDEEAPFFVLSLKAGGVGLNLTAASHVVHFDRWWNPAVEDQATDRAFRIGQKRNVLVHKLVCRGTVEEKVDALIQSKQSLAREVLTTGGEALLTEMGDADLLRAVSLDLRAALDAA